MDSITFIDGPLHEQELSAAELARRDAMILVSGKPYVIRPDGTARWLPNASEVVVVERESVHTLVADRHALERMRVHDIEIAVDPSLAPGELRAEQDGKVVARLFNLAVI